MNGLTEVDRPYFGILCQQGPSCNCQGIVKTYLLGVVSKKVWGNILFFLTRPSTELEPWSLHEIVYNPEHASGCTTVDL